MSKAILTTMIVVLLASLTSADFASDCLNAHNAYRAALNIKNLTWSTEIAASAQAWANKLASQRYLAHGSEDYGENLASRTGQYVNEDGTITSVDRPASSSQSSSSSTSSSSSSNASSTNSSTSASNTNSTSSAQTNRNLGGNGQNADGQRSGSFQPLIRSGDGGEADNFDRNNRRLEEESNEDVQFEELNEDDYERILANSKGTALVNSLINQWGAEQKYFTYGVFPKVKNNPDKVVGHFTQMIWGRTTQLGCGIANNDGGWVYFVCQYDPSGNWYGEPVY